MTHVLAFDTETELIRPGCHAPHLICAAFSDRETAELVHWTEARRYVVAMLESDYLLVGHNIAYDFGVVAAMWPELLPLIFSVYEADRITDTGIREKLQHIGLGVYRGFERVDGAFVKLEYSLGDIAERRCGIKLDKEGGWRLRYGEFKDVPLSFWPEEAKQYALGDPIATLMVYEHQDGDGKYLLEDQFRQTRSEWWLHLMSCWGLHTDEAGVQEFKRILQQKYDKNCEELIAADLLKVKKTKRKATGLVEVEIQRNTKKAKARMEEVCRAKGVQPDRTQPSKKHPEGQIQLNSDCCERSEDPLLIKYSEQASLSKQLTTDIPLLEQGMHVPIQPHFEVLLNTGRTASKPNVQNLPTSIGMRECFVPRPGFVYASADYSGFELRTVSQVMISCVLNGAPCRLAEALNAGIDPHLEVARRILGVAYEEVKAKQKSQERFPGTDETWKSKVYYARQSGKVCFHPDTEVLTRKGWKKFPALLATDEVCSAKLFDNGHVELEWEIPLALTRRRHVGVLVHLKNEGIDLRITPDHRMCGWKRAVYRDGRVQDSVVTCTPHETPGLRYWPNGGLGPGELQVDERLLRLAVATQADGTYKSKKVYLGFTKQRKVNRLRALLREGEYEFRLVGKQRVSTFVLSAELGQQVRALLTEDKKFPWWWIELAPELRAIALDEARFWDSHTVKGGTGYVFSSIHEENADVLQALSALTLGKSRKIRAERRQAQHSDIFRVGVKTKHRTRGGNLVPVEIPYDGEVFCLTTRNDTILVRDGGVPVITRQCNFGFPGGLGPERLVHYARNNYGVILAPPSAHSGKNCVCAACLKEYWLESWPEFQLYFKWIGDQTNERVSRIKQLFSNRYRGDVGFTDGANGMFQALAADAAKAAGFLIAKACYVDEASPLFGSRPVNFIHDEVLVETPDTSNAAVAAEELARLMVVGASPFLPDVPPVVEPQLSRRWSKQAEPIRDENKRLVPWDFPGGVIPRS